jgi:hypothetical protein
VVLQVLTKLVSAVDAPVVLSSLLTAASASVRCLVAAFSHALLRSIINSSLLRVP